MSLLLLIQIVFGNKCLREGALALRNFFMEGCVGKNKNFSDYEFFFSFDRPLLHSGNRFYEICIFKL
jgi:hypothetical protein